MHIKIKESTFYFPQEEIKSLPGHKLNVVDIRYFKLGIALDQIV